MAEKVDFDKYADDYDKLLEKDLAMYGEESGFFAEYKIKIIKNKLHRTPLRILEYGCGIGRNLEYVKKYFPDAEIWGCDISQKSLDIASQKNPGLNFFHLDKGEVNLKKEYFDLIFVTGVFHHIEPPLRINSMHWIFDMTSPNGNFFIFEHNPYNPVTRKIVDKCVWDTDAILLTAKESETLVLEAGFDLQEKKYTLFFPAFLSFMRFLEGPLGVIPLGGQYYLRCNK